MDEREHPISLSARVDGPTPTRRRPILSAKTRQSSISVMREISEGFAIALRAIGFDEILLSDLFRSQRRLNPEDR